MAERKRQKVLAALNKQKVTEAEVQNQANFLSARPGEPTAIKILNETCEILENHPINKHLKATNQFC